jgi:hypothetical protein
VNTLVPQKTNAQVELIVQRLKSDIQRLQQQLQENRSWLSISGLNVGQCLHKVQLPDGITSDPEKIVYWLTALESYLAEIRTGVSQQPSNPIARLYLNEARIRFCDLSQSQNW